MACTLLVADEDDRLALRLRQLLGDSIAIPAREKFPATYFKLGRDGSLEEGAIKIGDKWLELAALSGVLFRPLGRWRRVRNATTVQQAFVRHERRAAWCAWLSALPCPVANRFPPAWFLAGQLYSLELRRSFATACGLSARPRPKTASAPRESVYFVGGHIAGPGTALAVKDGPLRQRFDRVEQWCASTGIVYGRLEFAHAEGHFDLQVVDPVPSMNDADQDVLERVCQLLAARLG